MENVLCILLHKVEFYLVLHNLEMWGKNACLPNFFLTVLLYFCLKNISRIRPFECHFIVRLRKNSADILKRKNPQTSWGWKRSKITAFLTRLKFDFFFSPLNKAPSLYEFTTSQISGANQFLAITLSKFKLYFCYHTLI